MPDIIISHLNNAALTLTSAVCFGGNASEVYAKGFCDDDGNSITEFVSDGGKFE